MQLPQPTIRSTLALVHEETGVELSELKILLGKVTGYDRIEMITRDQQVLDMSKLAEFKRLALERAKGIPIAYLVGEKEFFSRPFIVNEHVLIPRPETEELVEKALMYVDQRARENLLTRVLDLGCGSGVIGITMALENPILEVCLSDISIEALKVAEANSKALGTTNITLAQSDAFTTLNPQQIGQFDLIISNPPYIADEDPHLEQGDLRFEPKIALTDFADGLHFYRKLAFEGKGWLKSTGAILVEHGYNQQTEVINLFREALFSNVTGFNDLGGTPRVVLAEL